MTTSPIISVTDYNDAYHVLRNQILQIAQLDANMLDDAAIELDVDLELHSAGQPKASEAYAQASDDQYDAFDAMMREGLASVPWPADIDSVLKELQEFQLYLAWAWRDNTVARWLLSGDASGWERQQAIQCGITAALSAQNAYFHALKILLAG